MISAAIYDDSTGMPILEIRESENQTRVIAMKALAAYSELWGIEDPVEVLEGIITDQDREHSEGEESPYKDAYTLLAHREQIREATATQAREERADKLTASDPRSVELRSALAAYRAVHTPIAPGEECAMDRCRRSIRDKLGLPEPQSKPGALSRSRATIVVQHERPELAPVGPPTEEQNRQDRRAQFSELLGQVTWMTDNDRSQFLHELSGNTENPLGDVFMLRESEPDETAEDLLGKYGAHHAT